MLGHLTATDLAVIAVAGTAAGTDWTTALREWAPVGIVAVGAVTSVVAVLTLRRSAKAEAKKTTAAAKKDGRWQGRMDEWKNRMDEFRENMEEFKDGATERLARIESTLDELVLQKRSIIKTKSPMTLNSLGEKVWRELDAAAWLQRHSAEVSGQARWLGEYDVQEFCFDYMSSLDLEPPHRNLVRHAAYRNGLTEFQVRQIMAIKLRDALLSTCPVCGEDATRNPPGGDWLRWICMGGCGDFRVSGSAAAVLRRGDRDLDVASVRACLEAKRENGCDSAMIGTSDLDDLTIHLDPARVAH